MAIVALVAAGGALGAVIRYGVSLVVRTLTAPSFFPFGTFLINVIGCFAFGAIVSVGDGRGGLSPSARAFLLVGILGGFTTFSSFGWETFELMRDGQIGLALVNVGGQFILGLLAVWAGYYLPRAI